MADNGYGIIDFRVRFRTDIMLRPWNIENPAPHFEQYIDLYKMKPRLTELAMKDFVAGMDVAGISKAVVCGGSIEENDHLHAIKDGEFGDRFFFIAGIHPKYGIRKNLNELEKRVEQGFLGVNLSPYIWGVNANENIFYPIFAFCEQNNLIAIIHGSLHYNRYQKMWLGDPQYIDEIAINFPELKIVVSHAFNGFGVLGLAVAQKNPNIYLEYSALWPKYLPESTIQAINSYLKERCLFGTDYPLVDFEPSVRAWAEAINPEVQKMFFEENAERCLFEKTV